jgi:hypothetical protein
MHAFGARWAINLNHVWYTKQAVARREEQVRQREEALRLREEGMYRNGTRPT